MKRFFALLVVTVAAAATIFVTTGTRAVAASEPAVNVIEDALRLKCFECFDQRCTTTFNAGMRQCTMVPEGCIATGSCGGGAP